MHTTDDTLPLLGPEGLLAKELPGYEHRPQQLTMSSLIGEAIANGQHAVVEAPTGVGKSLAYLVPAALHAIRNKRKVVISTGTIALQEQLIHKDIPTLQKVLPGLRAVLVKGRQNYLSLRRMEYATSGQQALFEQREQARELQLIKEWAATSNVGDRADLGYDPHPAVWRQVVSDANNCLGRRCPRYDSCFFYQARRAIEEADILVVNHHLYFADLALRGEHAAILPAHDVVIFDEAHGLEDVATDHLGTSISDAQIRYYLDGLWSAKGKGLLAESPWGDGRMAVEHCRQAADLFWRDVAALNLRAANDEAVQRIAQADAIDNSLSPQLDQLAKALRAFAGQAENADEANELKAQADRADLFAGTLRALISQQWEHYIYYSTVPADRGPIALTASPLSVAELLREHLWDATGSVVLTSATLAADDSDRFLFLRKRLGLEDAICKRLDSPFDYQRQARLLVNESPLDPNSERFVRATAQWVGDFLDQSPGGTFILFTSYRQMQQVHDLLAGRLERRQRFVLRQGGRMGRSQMLDVFKSTGNAILFGTASFWEGVDVRGEALQNVIIVKLPFETPGHPLVEARHQEIRRNGGNPFMERSVPEAILRLKQGIGRLIRTSSDSGTLVILDHRVLTKQYGRWFLRALPTMPTERIRIDQQP
ncbi:MAG: ATP-dependent DNA helicase [Planctomycetota bacterium]|nr:MAG: ATP-dependent DNA helicase [Planctomycetota bacterium]